MGGGWTLAGNLQAFHFILQATFPPFKIIPENIKYQEHTKKFSADFNSMKYM